MSKFIYSIENKAGKAVIKIVGLIGSWESSSERFTEQIDALIESGVEDLEVYLNSYGGSVFQANEIVNQLRRFKGTKTVQIGAIAASAASYLLPYFDKVKVFKNTQAMLHDPIMMVEMKSESDFESNKELYMNARTSIVDAYAKKLNVERSEIEAMMKKTTWLSAEKGKEIGLFDEILDDEGALPDDVKDIKNLYKEGLPVALVNSIETQTKKPKTKIEMKKVLIALGLPENTTEEKAVEMINSIKTSSVSAVTALATSKGFEKESIEKLANSDFDTTLKMVVDKKEEAEPNSDNKNVAELIANAIKGKGAEKTKLYADYSPEELEELCDKDPKAYAELTA